MERSLARPYPKALPDGTLNIMWANLPSEKSPLDPQAMIEYCAGPHSKLQTEYFLN